MLCRKVQGSVSTRSSAGSSEAALILILLRDRQHVDGDRVAARVLMVEEVRRRLLLLLLLLVSQTLNLTINLLVLGSVVCVRGRLRVGWRARGEHDVVLVLVELQRALVREVAVLLFEPSVG